MQFTGETQRMMLAFLLALVAVAGTAAYWAVTGTETILQREDNRRRVDAIRAIDRGDIYDRNGLLLATSVEVEGSTAMQRRYLHPAMNSTLGYYSFRFGEAGVERAYNPSLSGADIGRDWSQFVTQDLLHRRQVGEDVKVTLDLAAQRAVAQAMGDRSGGVVVLAVPSGAVISLVSQPSYDPNQIADTWDTLLDDPAEPFFNRVLQGNYQPGGTTKTLLLFTALLNRVPLDQMYTQATAPVQVGEVTLTCVETPQAAALTLLEAYQFGCPSPFAQLISQLGLETVAATYDLFRFDVAPELPGFIAQLPDAEATAEAATPPPTPTASDFTRADALGQGDITVTPLKMATLMAALLNSGNIPEPHVLLQTRPPNTEGWIDANVRENTLPLTTPEFAAQLRTLMQTNLSEDVVAALTVAGIEMGGQVALAYAGETTQTWFIGWARHARREGVAVAVLLEDSDDLEAAATIGGEALAASYNALYTATESP